MAIKRFSGGGKREMDKPLNLIPFISFLSVVVSFLIATAAWNQLVQIEILLPTDSGPSKTEDDPDKPKLSLTILVTTDNLQIAGAGGAIPPIEMITQQQLDVKISQRDKTPPPPPPQTEQEKERAVRMVYDLVELDAKLKQVQEKFPENQDAILAVESEVKYEKIVNVLDVALRNKITGLSLTAYSRAAPPQ